MPRPSRSPSSARSAMTTSGEAALEAFRRENLVGDYLKTVPGVPSGVALILVDQSGQNLISVAAGANASLSPADIDAVPEAVFYAAKVFLTCLETPMETVACGLRRARQAGLLTILNPAPASRRHRRWRSVDTGRCSDSECRRGGPSGRCHVRADDRYDEASTYPRGPRTATNGLPANR